MALATLDQVKIALGMKLADTTRDAAINQALPIAESLIEDYTMRRWVVNNPADPTTERQFVGEEAGFTTIDDAIHGSVTAVTLTDRQGTVTVLAPIQYIVQPTAGEYPVAWYLETYPLGRRSPEMGFARNEDVLYREGKLYLSDQFIVSVTARWGWPAIPDSVKMAAIWTTVAVIDNPRPYISEAIQGYSRTREAVAEAIPARARDALGRYVKG